MRKLSVPILLLAAVLMLGSCDMFRRIAGRPTSADIEAKRQLIEAERTAHLDRLDSAETVHRQLSDSVAALDSLRLLKDARVETRSLDEASRSQMPFRYYVIVGAFSKEENARRCSGTFSQNGYKPVIIRYSNGFSAVGVNPSDNISEVYASMQQVRNSGLCPDAWILDNKGE